MAKRCKGGRLLAEALKGKEVSQRQLEIDLGVASGLVTRWINGDRIPDVAQAVALRDRFGVPVDAWIQKRAAA